MQEEIQNKVAQSGLLTLNMEDLISTEPVNSFDLKDFLWHEMILKEKDYREALAELDWSSFKDAHVALFCSVDTIIPVWAFMLAATYLSKHTKSVFFGTEDELRTHLILQNIERLDETFYAEKRVVIKGCGKIEIPSAAYVAISSKLVPVVRSLMYGEPCSTVPIFKRKNV